MNSLNAKNKLKTAFIVASTAVLAAGCSSTRHAGYSSNQAPLAMTDQSGEYGSMGGTGSSSQTQYGSGSSQAYSSDQAAAASAQISAQNLVIPLQQEQLRVGTQQINAGGVRLRKTVTSETVSQPIQLRRESLTVDRLPANAQANANQGAAPQFSGSDTGGTQSSSAQNPQGTSLGTPFQQGEMVINLTREQPIVQTEIVPAGSVVVRRQVITEPVNVQHQVRRENVQAFPIGNPQNVNISSNLMSSAQGQASNAPSSANEASGAAPSTSGQSSGAGGSPAITQLSQLSSASDKSSLAGQSVNLSGAKVQQIVGDRLITIMAPDGTAIFVRTAQPVTGLTSGQRVALNGMVRQVPQSSGISSLGLDERSSQALQGQQIFIDANSVTPSSQ
ncbi:MAG: hypothetical protein JWQ71_181 [Pedosphaera sp.]|nr:hypothetical protein [Pedosphaera sp.]